MYSTGIGELYPRRGVVPAKKYRIELTTEEQQELKALVSKGRAAAYKQTHARILLLSDEARKDGGLTDEEVARSLEIASATVERIRRRCVEEGIEAALGRKEQQRRRPKKLDGAAEAHLIALACGEPPEGRACWTLRLLADRLVECGIVESIHPETVRKTLKKNELKPWLKECWCIPPEGSSDFVCAMEDVLEVYHRPYEDNEVLVCLDETSKQQVKETRLPRPPRPGLAVAYDYEYQRNGVSNLFMLFAPLEGWRRVGVTDRRTKVDWAHQVKKLVDEDYPDKDRIVLVMDNLNTHHPASYTRRSSLWKRGVSPNVWRFTTPPSMGVGWIWPRLKSECWPGSAWTAGFLIKRRCAGKLTPGRTSATGTWCEWTGASLPMTRASS